MAESNRRRLERLEQMAHVSVGDARIDVLAAIELEAEILEAEIKAYTMLCALWSKPGHYGPYGPESARTKQMAEDRRYKLRQPLVIKELCKALEQRVREYGATPTVQAVLVAARQFLAAAT